jgi:hypothetical protein
MLMRRRGFHIFNDRLGDGSEVVLRAHHPLPPPPGSFFVLISVRSRS